MIYTGVNCERLQDKCVGIQCLNGGQCINNGINLTCSCAKGYHGENCELIIDYCQSQPVSNILIDHMIVERNFLKELHFKWYRLCDI